MKLLTVAIPCYNSAEYMHKAIESALPGDERIEIVVIDDGSSDRTEAVAREYEERYPRSVRLIRQPNKGHGGAVMTGIRAAQGQYFKVLDSDDWLDEEAFPRLVDALERCGEADMVVSNYIYDKVGSAHPRVVRYTGVLPEERIFGWSEVGRFREGQYMLMHALIYRTELLRTCGLELPEHTFYVDNLFAYIPFPSVEKLYYLNADVYHYFIGREDQSIHESVMIRRIDQQLLVNRIMYESVDLTALSEPKLCKYMRNYLEIISAVSTILLFRGGTSEHLEKAKKLWEDFKEEAPGNYRLLQNRPLSRVARLRGPVGRRIALQLYAVAQKIYGFN